MEWSQGLGVPEHRLHPVALRRSGEQIHLTKDTGLGRNHILGALKRQWQFSALLP